MTTIGPEDERRNPIVELVEKWERALPLGVLVRDPEKIAVPAELAATITESEPWRSRALEDARYFLSIGTTAGIGLRALLENTLSPQPHLDWAESISPLNFRMAWSYDMGGTMPEWYDGSFHRVAVENGSWRVVEFWSEKDRASNRDALEALRKHLKPTLRKTLRRFFNQLVDAFR